MIRQVAPAYAVPQPQQAYPPQWDGGSLREVAKPIENYISWSSESFYPEELIDLRGNLPPYLARTSDVPSGASAEIVQVFTWGAQTRALCTDQAGRNLSLLIHSPIKYKYLVKKKAMSKPMLLPDILKKVPTLPLVIYPTDEEWTNSPQCQSIESLAIRHVVDERFLVCGKLIRGDQGIIRCLFTIPESLRVKLVTAEGLTANPHYSAVDWDALLAQLVHVGQSLRLNASLLETALIREITPTPVHQDGVTPSEVLKEDQPTPEVEQVNSLRPSGPLPPPPPPSLPPEAEVPDESFHYYTLNGIVKEALRAALRVAHAEGKLTADTQDGLKDIPIDKITSLTNPSKGVNSNSPNSPHQMVHSPGAPRQMQSQSNSQSQASDSKRSSLSSEGSTPNSLTRTQMVNKQQQLQVPTVAPQRSRSPFRRAPLRKQTIPTVNLGQRSLNSGQKSQEVGQRSTNQLKPSVVGQRTPNQSQRQEVGQRSLESSQRSLDSGYRSLENRGRSPAPDRRARSPPPETPRGINQISQSTSALYQRNMSHPPTSAVTYSRSVVIPNTKQNRHQNFNPRNINPQIQSQNAQSSWQQIGQQSDYQTTMAAYESNNDQIDHYSASIENLSLRENEKKGAVTIHVKGDSPDHYRYSDTLPVTDDGYLSPREVRQAMSPSDLHGNRNNHSNHTSNVSHDVSEDYSRKITMSTPVKKRSTRSVSALDDVPADLSQLTVEEISHILKLLNLDHHKDKFLQNMIDGAMLMDLAADDLRDLGLSRVECTRLNKFVREGWRPKMQ